MSNLNASQHQLLLVNILKGVSRSFYLTLRILPKQIREQISVAYLIARAADTMADTSVLAPPKRIEALTQFRSMLINGAENKTVLAIQEQIKNRLSNKDELRLLESLPQLFYLFEMQIEEDRELIRNVVLTLTEGMIFDLHAFPSEESGHLKALDKASQTDKYTYLVAGCVGEFWTDMSLTHIPALAQCNRSEMSDLGIRYGKALQMTNILRDLPRDLRIGRCYLPTEWLQQHGLKLEMLLDKRNAVLVAPLYAQAIEVALKNYQAAEAYVLAIPASCTRLRLAALWPLMIGLATLKLLAESDDFLNFRNVIKVRRSQVYKIIWQSFWCVGSNQKLSSWIASEMRSVELKESR